MKTETVEIVLRQTIAAIFRLKEFPVQNNTYLFICKYFNNYVERSRNVCTINLLRKDSEVYLAEAVARRCSVKKVFWKILQNSQENTYTRVSFLKKLQPRVCNFIKKEALVQMFSSEYCKIFETPFLLNSRRLLLIQDLSTTMMSCFREIS